MKSDSTIDAAEKLMNEYQQKVLDCYEMVLEFFEGDREKAELWFETPNPSFGGTTPDILIYMGRVDVLKKWIEAAIEGY